MQASPTILQGEFCVPLLVQEAAERSLKLAAPACGEEETETPFGSGRVSIQEVQPGLRYELISLTCHQDHDFNFIGGPLITCGITLEGSTGGVTINNYGAVENQLNQPTLIGFGEPTSWTRQIREGQHIKAFGFTLEPTFFDRFSNVVEDEQLSVLEKFRTDLYVQTLPRSRRLIKLGRNAFDHSYSGSLAALYNESNTLQSVLEVIKLLREEGLLVTEIGHKHYERLMHARDILDGALINPPKTLDLARQVGSNIRTLQSHFKFAFGTTIFGYIRKRRLEMARVLIVEHQLGSAQAGYRVGFSNPAAFSAAYRKYFGHSPSTER